jgi:hypothetical protein
MRCKGRNKASGRCGAPAVIGSELCVMHSGRAAELGSKGGRRRAIFNPETLKRFPAPQTAAEVRDLLAQCMVEVRAGELEPRIATSICGLVGEFLKTLELCTIEEVVEPLERERARQRGASNDTDGEQKSS